MTRHTHTHVHTHTPTPTHTHTHARAALKCLCPPHRRRLCCWARGGIPNPERARAREVCAHDRPFCRTPESKSLRERERERERERMREGLWPGVGRVARIRYLYLSPLSLSLSLSLFSLSLIHPPPPPPSGLPSHIGSYTIHTRPSTWTLLALWALRTLARQYCWRIWRCHAQS